MTEVLLRNPGRKRFQALIATLILLFAIPPAHAAPYVVVLGTAQDGGYPQAGCNNACCAGAWKDASVARYVSCLALVDPEQNYAWLFDITPDFRQQWKLLQRITNDSIKLAGIFLTHAHAGHYTGLINTGREMMNMRSLPVYAMPRMKKFLESNGPWSLLVELGNIKLHAMSEGVGIPLPGALTVVPIIVPHRDEFSETVGFRIGHLSTSMLFIPDIDKWEKWDRSLGNEVKSSRYAFIDATFFSTDELPGRNMKEVPHPLVNESMGLLANLAADEKGK